jgi:hypothetical protein
VLASCSLLLWIAVAPPAVLDRGGTGTFLFPLDYLRRRAREQEADMNGLIYLVGLIVVILAILSFFGLR